MGDTFSKLNKAHVENGWPGMTNDFDTENSVHLAFMYWREAGYRHPSRDWSRFGPVFFYAVCKTRMWTKGKLACSAENVLSISGFIRANVDMNECKWVLICIQCRAYWMLHPIFLYLMQAQYSLLPCRVLSQCKLGTNSGVNVILAFSNRYRYFSKQ